MAGLYKDNKRVQHVREQKKCFGELANAIRNKTLEVLLLGNTEQTRKFHEKDHSCCGFDSSKHKPNVVTEKRMCRCMYYMNKISGPDKKCCECSYASKWKLQTKGWSFMDYELPFSSVTKGIGGIDLVVRHGDVEYAVEMKSSTSRETVSRMVAEALTYNIGGDTNMRQPAIGFFKGSRQHKHFKELQGCDDFLFVMREKKVAVLLFEEISCSDEGIHFFEIKEIPIIGQ